MLVTAIVQIGMVMHDYLDLTDAVRTGGRAAAVSRTVANPAAAVESSLRAAGDGLEPSSLAVTVASTWQPGSDVKVTATYPYTISIFGIPLHTGSLASSTTQRVE
jgi:Flp pilus assembly protein TadG